MTVQGGWSEEGQGSPPALHRRPEWADAAVVPACVQC